MYVSFRPSFTGPEVPAWIDGWTWQERDWHFRVCRQQHGRWIREVQHPRELLGTRAFEPSTVGLKTEGTEVRRFAIHDISNLGALLEPREVLGPMLCDDAASSQHAIFVHQSEEGRIYLPAWLLIGCLWAWSQRALRALFMPNGLDLFIQSFPDELLVSPEFASSSLTKIAESRIRWLAGSEDARASWASVLTNAYQGRVDLLLPKASMRGWLWGAHVRGGLLASELASVELSCSLDEIRPVRVTTTGRARAAGAQR